MDNLYNQNYYENYDTAQGKVSYKDATDIKAALANAATQIAKTGVKTVLDVGCATGHLVVALRDLGIEAYGIDISEYAISQVREDIRPFCAAQSILAPLPKSFPEKFDLVVTIEMMEHTRSDDTDVAISQLCSWSDRVIFSSTPDDFEDPTHLNVQQPPYWAVKFAQQGFYHNLQYVPDFISSHAVCFEKRHASTSDLVFDYEHLLQLLKAKKHDSFISRLYFDLGTGFSEEKVTLLTGYASELFHHRVYLPAGCGSVRFDPMEGSGCMLWNLQVRSESQSISLADHNGSVCGNVLLFNSIDPQLYFRVPSNCRWVEISAEITPMAQTGWLELCVALQQLHTDLDESTSYATELQRLLHNQEEKNAELDAQIEKKNAELDAQITDLENLEDEKNALSSEITAYQKLVAHERSEAQKVAEAYAYTLNSTSWKITKPMRFASRCLRKVLRPFKKVFVSLKVNGVKTTVKKVVYKLRGKTLPPVLVPTPTPASNGAPHNRKTPLADIASAPIDPIETVIVQDSVKRLNLVTDTIDSHSLLGGVATALVVATEFANRYHYALRIITRNSDVNPTNYYNIMEISGIKPAENVSFYSDFERKIKDIDYKLEVTKDDIFFATSWWSAQAIAATTVRPRFFYIIQEVETFFYNYGGEHLLCSQMMENKNIDYIVNSRYLYDYFRENNPHIVENGCYFEPAFPEKLYHTKTFTPKSRYKLFFYARPNNPRNLYSIGVYMLNRAVERGILDTEEWDVYCVGQNAPVIQFSNGAHSINLGQLSWTEYAKFLTDIDLGLCLMYTPHPSYPPFDVACSGGVVLTNKMMNKTNFPYCKNVIVADLEEDTFMDAFAESIALAKNMQERKHNYDTNTICRNWQDTLSDTITYMGGKI